MLLTGAIDLDRIQAEIGVFGGSGFYSLLENVVEVKVDTPYGSPSDSLSVATLHGRQVAFLPRHGRSHSIPPHKVNYRANVWAFKRLGIKAVISPCAAGSLQRHVQPGDFVVCDQWVDRTWGRGDTFYEGPIVSHVSPADPYNEQLRQLAISAIKDNGIPVHATGTVVVVNGPRFSTKAESQWFTKMGWEVINMTQYPEAYLCKELGMAVVNISLITDHDCGIEGHGEAVNAMSVLEVFKLNSERIRKVVYDLIGKIPDPIDQLYPAAGLEWSRGDVHAAHPSDLRQYEF